MPPEPESRIDDALVEAVEDYHRRAAAGEAVPLGLYRERLGEHFPDFQAVVRAEQVLDDAMAPPLEPPAEQLPRPFGPFTLVRELGRGGVGVVYEAVDRRLGRTLAVKVLKVSFDVDDVALERFRREASACARVRHDHIVPIFESGDVEGQPFYAMDLVPGEPLSDVIRDGRAPEPRALCRELAHLADALQALHDGGVIHRDVKPHNVMVRPDGRMVLTDFGLARTQGAASLTQTGQALGTPLYMSPEQVHGDAKKIVPATDVYGLGAVLYEALTGHPPFPMTEYPRLLYNVLHVRPEPPRALHPEVPEACERIALKALEKEPRDRYATAAAMAADLRAFADERPVLGRPVSRTTRAGRWVLRRKVPLGLAALALGAVGWWWTHRPAVLEFDDEDFPIAGIAKIDGSAVGSTGTQPTLRVERVSGTYDVVVERDGFEPIARRWTIGAGETRPFPLVLLPRTQEALDAVRRHMHITALVDGGTRASGESRTVTILAPRGDVRPSDLDDGWIVDVDPMSYVEGGRLILSHGAEPVWSHPFSPSFSVGEYWACGTFPPDVKARLQPGDQLQMTWEPPVKGGGGLPRQEPVSLRVLGSDPSRETLERLTRLSGNVDSPEWVRLRVEALVQHGLRTAAVFDAVRLVLRDPARQGSWKLLGQVLARSGTEGSLLLEIELHLAGQRPAPRVCGPLR